MGRQIVSKMRFTVFKHYGKKAAHGENVPFRLKGVFIKGTDEMLWGLRDSYTLYKKNLYEIINKLFQIWIHCLMSTFMFYCPRVEPIILQPSIWDK